MKEPSLCRSGNNDKDDFSETCSSHADGPPLATTRSIPPVLRGAVRRSFHFRRSHRQVRCKDVRLALGFPGGGGSTLRVEAYVVKDLMVSVSGYSARYTRRPRGLARIAL